jgi:hypothetical protein
MTFYVVEGQKIVTRHMCDNPRCPNYRTREEGMPMERASTDFHVCSMQKFDACSPECRSIIEATQHRICI